MKKHLASTCKAATLAFALASAFCAPSFAENRPGTEEMSIAGLRLDEPMSRYGQCGAPQAAADGPCWRPMGGTAQYDQVIFQWPAKAGETPRAVTAVVIRGRIDSLLLAVSADTPQALERAKDDALRASGRKWSGWRGPVMDHGRKTWFGPGAIGEIVEAPNAVAVMLSTPDARKLLLAR